MAEVDIEEYRVPLFSVIAEAENEVGPIAHVEYFVGILPWRAQCRCQRALESNLDRHQPRCATKASNVTIPTPKSARASILMPCRPKPLKAILNSTNHGRASLECESPFKNNPAVGLCDISWRAEVTSMDGQTLVGGASAISLLCPGTSGRAGNRRCKLTPKPCRLKFEAFDLNNQPVTDIDLQSDLFFVVTKTVKEQVAPFVYRYRNTDRFTKIASQELKGSGTIRFDVQQTGRYVVAVSCPWGSNATCQRRDNQSLEKSPRSYPLKTRPVSRLSSALNRSCLERPPS